MPANPRVRDNNVFGQVDDSPLTAGATSMNSTGLTSLSAVVTKHATVTLDPLRQYGDPEIVVITTHTASSSVATITRGAYGTSARSHPQGTLWVHAPLNEDFTVIVTSGSRPSDPYRGQMIFESDTDKFVARSQLDIWQDVMPLGAWQTWVPTWTNFTVGGGTVTARYVRMGRTILYSLRVILSGSTMGSDPRFSLPVTSFGYSATAPIGTADYLDTGTVDVQGLVWASSTTTGRLIVYGTAGTYPASIVLAAGVPFTWANGDEINVTGAYEAAS